MTGSFLSVERKVNRPRTRASRGPGAD